MIFYSRLRVELADLRMAINDNPNIQDFSSTGQISHLEGFILLAACVTSTSRVIRGDNTSWVVVRL